MTKPTQTLNISKHHITGVLRGNPTQNKSPGDRIGTIPATPAERVVSLDVGVEATISLSFDCLSILRVSKIRCSISFWLLSLLDYRIRTSSLKYGRLLSHPIRMYIS